MSVIATFHKLPASDLVNVNFKVFTSSGAGTTWNSPAIDYTFTNYYETTAAYLGAIHGFGNIRNVSINNKYVSTTQFSIQYLNVAHGGVPYDMTQAGHCTLSPPVTGDDSYFMPTVYNQALRPLLCVNPKDKLTFKGCFSTASRPGGCQDFPTGSPNCPYPLPGFFSVGFR